MLFTIELLTELNHSLIVPVFWLWRNNQINLVNNFKTTYFGNSPMTWVYCGVNHSFYSQPYLNPSVCHVGDWAGPVYVVKKSTQREIKIVWGGNTSKNPKQILWVDSQGLLLSSFPPILMVSDPSNSIMRLHIPHTSTVTILLPNINVSVTFPSFQSCHLRKTAMCQVR